MKWKKGTPNNDRNVLVALNGGEMYAIGFYRNGWVVSSLGMKVTHWTDIEKP